MEVTGEETTSFSDSSTSCLKETEVSLPCVQMLLGALVLVMLILGLKIGTFSSSFKSEERISTRGESLLDKDKLPIPWSILQYSPPHLQTMSSLLMYYTMFRFQLNHKKLPFVFFGQLN